MSNPYPTSDGPRPLSFNHEDDRQWQVEHDTPESPSPRYTPTAAQPIQQSASTRWSRISMAPNSDESQGSEGTKDEKKDGPNVTITSKGFRTGTDLTDTSESVLGELPKMAIKSGFRKNWKKLLPHILAAIVTVAVCQLSFRDIYWLDLKTPHEKVALGLTQGGALNALQLAAKLHELLIMASISSIVLHAVQHHLNGVTGLPFGLITNAFELGSGQFLFRSSFWSMLWRPDPVTGKRSVFLPFWLLSLFACILVTLAGPSSAIAVIPNLGYFNLPKAFNQTSMPYYVMNKTMELWPTELNAGSLKAINDNCSSPTSLPSVNVCPGGGFRDTYDWSTSVWFGDSDSGTNISFADPTGTTRRLMTTQSCNSTYSGRASAMGLTSFMSAAMTTFWVFAHRNFNGMVLKTAHPRMSVDPATQIYAPRVEVICSAYNNDNYTAKDLSTATNMFFPTFGDEPPVPVPDQYYRYARNLSTSNFTYVGMPKTSPLTPSLGAVLAIPFVWKRDNGSYYQTTENMACSIYTQWMPVSIWYEPSISDQVTYGVQGDLQDTCLSVSSVKNSRKLPINNTITKDYADAINQLIQFDIGPRHAMTGILNRFTFSDGFKLANATEFRAPVTGTAITTNASSLSYVMTTEIEAQRARGKFIATLIAGVVGDGIARVAGNGRLPYSGGVFLLSNLTTNGSLQGRDPSSTAIGGSDKPLNATRGAEKSWLLLNPTFQRYGYGYHWFGSQTTQFGISILLIHLLAAIIHAIVVISNVTGKYGGLPSTPENIPEMLALAVNSRESERLRNTCAGIEKSGTYVETLAIRETWEGHLEFVVGGEEIRDGGLGLPRVGVLYGALPEVEGRKDV